MTEYVELHAHSWFSFLRASTSPEALVAQAQKLGMRALALTDNDNLSGAIKFSLAAKEANIRPIIGAEVTLTGNQHLTLLAENQTGYANLCRLLTSAHLGTTPTDPSGKWLGKTQPALNWQSLETFQSGLIALSGCRQGPIVSTLVSKQPAEAEKTAVRLYEIFGKRNFWIELQHHNLPNDDNIIRELHGIAEKLQLGIVATNDVHYATQDHSQLCDALIAVSHILTLDEARRASKLPLNSNYYLASPYEMTYRFRELPEALRNTLAIAERCNVSLDFSGQRLPAFPVHDGYTEFSYLYKLCHEGLARRYPNLEPRVLNQMTHELEVIQNAGLAGFFLIVWDIVRYAREIGVRCQGRGSAANSTVAYLLGVTSVDPIQQNLLFERFLSADRHTTPDIDLDFAADTREKVIQYVYQKYGASHVAMVANIITYRAKSAVRDVGKALGFPLPVLDELTKKLETNNCRQAAQQLLEHIDDAAPAHPMRLLSMLVSQMEGCPRHLGIHSGGMLITALPLDEVVPLERATMENRIIAQWDKNSVEDAGLIKLDVLGLGMLGMITKALGYIENAPDLDSLTLDDAEIYEMLCQADTIGAFQVESRAQQQMLPRLRPKCFNDIVIEVAIVRPGPILGNFVHPFLKRRNGDEKVEYLHPSLQPVLEETLGVVIFQEQTIRVAMCIAGLSPGDADYFRRALSRNDDRVIQGHLRERFIQGAEQNHIDRTLAETIFQLLAGYAGFGFCKSHAASFALIAYQSMHLKRYYPAEFYCALLNSQPMGFYSDEVVVNNARLHGIEILPPEINTSDFGYILETTYHYKRALRIGISAIDGLGTSAWERIKQARDQSLFGDVRDFCIRTRLPKALISNLIFAGAFDRFGERRDLEWALGSVDFRPEELPIEILPEAAEFAELDDLEQSIWEYELMGVSAAGQIMRHYRDTLKQLGILSSVEAKRQGNGHRLRAAGMAVVKQRPATANGILFVSLEDEEGMLDLVVKPDVYDRYRDLIRGNTFMCVEGVIQQGDGAISLLVTRALEFPRLNRQPD